MITAVVSNGDLLIELEDGSVVNAGRVQGPPGRDGSQGLSGFPGQEGRPGRDGKDGASIHTGFGTPEASAHKDGDLYIDVQTVDLSLYQKIAGSWARIGGLKGNPGPPGANGANGAAGGGGSIIIWPGTNNNDQGPDKDNEGNPINNGDLWFDPEKGYLYVYLEVTDSWVEVSDHPPVIISATPPQFNNSSDTTPGGRPKYYVRPGDLWFDSEQLALYVLAEDADGSWVWVIATPANRTAVSDEVNTFVFPAGATDRQEEYNPVTDTWYVYNKPKRQWIDFEPNDDPCLEIYGYILNYNGNTSTNTAFANVNYFAFAIYSRTDYPDNRYNEHYLDAGDGLGWQKIEDMDAATLEKYGINSVTEWQVNFVGPSSGNPIWNDQNIDFPDAQVKGIAIQMDADGNDLLDEDGDVIQVESPAIRIYDDPAISIDERDLQPVIASCGPGQSPGKRYLLAHGDDVQDTEGSLQYYRWKDGVVFRNGDDTAPPGAESRILLADTFLELTCNNGPTHLKSPKSVVELNAHDNVKIVAGSDISNTASRDYLVYGFRDTVIKAGLSSTEDGNIKLEATGGGELVERTIDDTDDPKQIVNKEYVDGLEVECIAEATSLFLSSGVYKRLNDNAVDNMIRGSQDGPGNPMLMTQFVFGVDVDVEAIKVNSIFGLTYGADELNLYRALNKYVNNADRVVIEVEPISAESSVFQNGVAMSVSLELSKRVDADCLRCSSSDETICAEIGQLHQDIITLDEEIESIVGSMEKGFWRYEEPSDTNRPPLEGRFYLVKNYTSGAGGLGAEFTQEYSEAEAAVFSKKEWNPNSVDGTGGKNHTFDDVEVDELIDLLDRPDPDQLTGKITEVDKDTHDHAVIIAFDTFTAEGGPTNHSSGVHETLLKIFKEPDGGTADEFVRKAGNAGGHMTGDLTLNTTNEAIEWDHNNLDAKLTFKNTKGDGSNNYINLYKNGSGSILSCDKTLRTEEDLILGSGKLLKAKTSSGTDLDGKLKFDTDWLVFQWGTSTNKDRFVVRESGGEFKQGSKKQGEWSTNGGKLKYNDYPRLTWNSNRIQIDKPVNNTTNADGFKIIGATTSNNNYTSNTIGSQTGSLLVAKHVNNQPDHIEYRGKITTSTDIVNKAYVDNKVSNVDVDFRVRTTTSSSFSIDTGEFVLNTATKVLYIGV
nr:hypothetical protein 35 [bacterium]